MLPDRNSVVSESVEITNKVNLLSSIKQAVLKKEYHLLQSLCLNYVTKNISASLSELWEVIEYLTRPTIGLIDYAKSISLFFFEYLLQHSYYSEALDHLRHICHLVDADRKLRQKIVELYRNQYYQVDHLDVITSLSGITESNPLSQAIVFIDKLIGLSVGNPVYSSRFGYGEVTKIDFILDTILINFFQNQVQIFTFDQAIKSLQLISKDNFNYLKQKNPTLLARLIKENPQELYKILQRDIGSNTSDIKQALKNYVNDDDIKFFLGYIKKSFAKSKIKPEKDVSEQITSIDYDELLTMQPEKIIELISKVPSIKKQKIISDLSRRADWLELSIQLFLSQSDKRFLEIIYTNFSYETKMRINDKLLTEYKQYPLQFLLISEIIKDKDSYLFLNRYLDLVNSKLKLTKISITREIRKRLIANKYDIVKKSVEQMTSDIAKRTWLRIRETNILYPEEYDAIKKIFQSKFPEMFTDQTEYIYHTQTAIKNKTKELQDLINKEIPRVAAEIGRARGYGDLRENFEYKSAKEKQKRLLHQVSQLRYDLAKAKPIDFTKIDTTKVSIGTRVKLLATEDNSYLSYAILGPWDSDVSEGIISYLTPFANLMLNKLLGDEIVDTEGKTYRIIEITKAEL